MSDRPGPRISVNKLGEYMVASAARRRRIIMDQKRPREFIVTRYRDALSAMVDFLVGGTPDDGIIYRAMLDLEARPAATDFQMQDRDLSIEALELFLDTVDELQLDGLDVQRTDQDTTALNIGGVSVSVRPDVFLRGTNRQGDEVVGCVKLYVSKTFPLNDVAGGYIGALLSRYTDEVLATNGRTDHRLCQVMDVFGQHVFPSPRAVRRRRDDLEAACQEIATLWDAV